MKPSTNALLSKALGNLRVQLRTGKTRGKNPRLLTERELEVLEERRCVLENEMAHRVSQRLERGISAHITSQSDRVIIAVREVGAEAQSYFANVGGAGSAEDLRLRGKSLIERAKGIERDTRKAATQQRRANARRAKAEERVRHKAERQRTSARATVPKLPALPLPAPTEGQQTLTEMLRAQAEESTCKLTALDMSVDVLRLPEVGCGHP